MKRIVLVILSIVSVLQAYSQVTINKPISFSSSGANAKISNIDNVSQDKDAVSVEVLQAGRLIYDGVATGSSATEYKVTLSPAIAGYTEGMIVNFRATVANAAGVKVNVNNRGAITVTKDVTTALGANDIAANQLVSVIFDGSNFQLLGGSLPKASGNYVQNNPTNSNFATGQVASFDITNNVEIGGTLFAGGNTAVGTLDNVSFNGTGAAKPLVVAGLGNSAVVADNDVGIVVRNNSTVTGSTSGLHFAAFNGATSGSNYNPVSASIVGIHGARTLNQYQTGQLAFLTSTAVNTAPSEKMRLDNNGNLGIGATQPQYKLHVAGGIGLDGGGNYRKALTPTFWGYSNTYRVMMIGSTSTTYNVQDGAVTVAFNYDPSSNTNGAFQGDGREILFRNGTQFVTPNAANNAYSLYNLVLKDGNVGIGVPSPTNPLEVSGNIIGGRTSQMWTASRTGAVVSTSWTTIPGLSVSVSLARAATLQITASGTMRANGTDCHQGFRKQVDGTPYGDGSHGERLQMMDAQTIWWDIWSYSSYVSLAAGAHTIEFQTRDSGGGSGCVICAELPTNLYGYTNCDLIVTAVYQ